MLNATKQPRKALSELEHKIMQVLWKQGPVNSEQVRLALAARHPMKDSTIRTMLRRLQEKGYVKHRVEGRTFIYSGVEAPGMWPYGRSGRSWTGSAKVLWSSS